MNEDLERDDAIIDSDDDDNVPDNNHDLLRTIQDALESIETNEHPNGLPARQNPWTHDEDKMLIQLVQDKKYSWIQITDSLNQAFPTRPAR